MPIKVFAVLKALWAIYYVLRHHHALLTFTTNALHRDNETSDRQSASTFDTICWVVLNTFHNCIHHVRILNRSVSRIALIVFCLRFGKCSCLTLRWVCSFQH